MALTMHQWALSGSSNGPFEIVDTVTNIINEPLFQVPVAGPLLYNLLQTLLGNGSTITAVVQGTTELGNLTAGQITSLGNIGTTLIDPVVNSVVPLATGLLMSQQGIGFVDDVVMTVTAPVANLTGLNLTQLQSLADTGITLVDPVVNSVIPIATGLLVSDAGLSFVDDVVMTVTGTIQDITALDPTDLASLADIGVTLVDPVVDSVLPLVTGLLMAENGLGFVDDVVMTVTGTVQDLADLDIADLQSLAEIGTDVLSAGGGIVEFTLEQLTEILDLGMVLDQLDIITLVTSVVDLVGLTVQEILDLVDLGIEIIDVTDGPLEITVAQALAFAQAEISFEEDDVVIISDFAINIEAMSVADISAVADINVDSIDAINDVLSLSAAQLAALGVNGIALTPGDVVTLADTAATIGALSTTAIGNLGAMGVDAVDAANDRVTLTLAQFNAFANASIDMAAGDVVTIRDTAANIAALTGGQLATLAASGADQLDAIGNVMTLTAAQAKAIAANGLAFVDDDVVTLIDTGANIISLTAGELAALSDAGVDAIDIIDGSISMTVSQAVGLASAGLAFAGSDIVRIIDTGTNIAALTAAEIAALKAAGVDSVDATNNAISLTVEQAMAFAESGLNLVSADVVTLVDTGARIAALTATELAALKDAGIDAIDASNNALSLTAAGALAMVEAGFVFAASDVVTIADTASNIAALTVQDIEALADAGLDAIDATNNALSLTLAQLNALADAGIEIAAADVVTLADTAANLAALTAGEIAGLANIGADQLHSLSGAAEITLEQAQALAGAGLAFVSTDIVGVVDAGADIADLTAGEIADLVAAGVDYVDAVEDAVTLTLEQAETFADGSMAFAEEDVVTVNATAAELLALTSNDLANLAAAGVDFVDAVENEVALTIAQAKALAANGIAHVDGDVVSVAATGAQLSDLTANEMAQLAAAGVDLLDATDDTVTLTAAAAKSFVEGNMQFDDGDTVTIADTGANIADLTAGNLTDLKAAGVDVIDATNNILLLSKAQLQAFTNAGFTFVSGDTVTLADTGTNLAALGTTEIANLAVSNVDTIDATNGSVTFTMEQVVAFRTAGIAFTAADVVTLSVSAAEVKSMSAQQFAELRNEGVDRFDLTDDVISLKAAAWKSLKTLDFADDDVVTVSGTSGRDKLTAHGDGTIILNGGKGRDVLRGGDDDLTILDGGKGKDRLIGGDGVDQFLFDTKANRKNVDKVSEFDTVEDRILLDNNVFKAIGASLGKQEFYIGREAHDGSDHIIYDRKSGSLFYDKDGEGGRDQVKIASFEPGLKLTLSDFDIV